MNLLEPPHSAYFSAFCRSTWTSPAAGEAAAPAHRIIHARGVRLPVPVRLERLGLRAGRGYFKCGSDPWPSDFVTDVRVLAGDGLAWKPLVELNGLRRPPAKDETTWIDLGPVEAATALVQLRRSEVDGWWPSWNLATSGVSLDGSWDGGAPVAPYATGGLRVDCCSLRGLPRGVEATIHGGEVRYRTRYFQVGFRLRKAAFSFLALDDEGAGRVDRNLLAFAGFDYFVHPLREHFVQGIRLAPVAGPAAVSFYAHGVEGTCRVAGPVVEYDVLIPAAGQRYRLRWEVREDGLRLSAERTGDRPLRAWESSAWHVSFDSRVSPVSTIGAISREGETGMLDLPVLLHAPGFGTLDVTAVGAAGAGGAASWRSDSARPVFACTGELKLGETCQPEGDHLLAPGTHAATVEWRVRTPRLVAVQRQAPAAVARALARCAVTALPFRPDTATLSNNGNSMHAPICMDNWSALAVRMEAPVPGLPAHVLLGQSIERWLDGGQGYASGPSARTGGSYEDEYLMTPVACLLGIAEMLEASRDAAWLAARAADIRREIDAMRARDVDDDGLIESRIRLGKSGSHQWSTNWFDVLSFGWKDAFTNALLYRALRLLPKVLAELGQPGLADGLDAWADRLAAAYTPCFLNPATGWLAGWRCADDRLHDHAFVTVNGAAVVSGVLEPTIARDVVQRLWAEMRRVGFDDFRLGLPWNLHHIPDEDLGTWNTARPLGFYVNGGVGHSQSRHFVGALYAVGMRDEADRVLEALCASLGDGTAFGGCASGVDLRTWDGTPCGYEGLLCDQLGILAVAVDRWGARGP